MVYVNLIPSSPKRWRRVIPVALACLGTFTTGVLALVIFLAAEPLQPLAVDERQIVVAGLDALAAQVPEISEWAEDAADGVADDTVPVFLGPEQGGSLVSYHDGTLIFSRRFFEADSMAQANALLHAVLSLRQPVLPAADEVAVRPAE